MKVTVCYFAMLREQRGCPEETLETDARTPEELYQSLADTHGFNYAPNNLKVAIDQEMGDWTDPLRDGQTISFIPPVSGG